MFGYVRPLRGELKVLEYERFKAAYCGLCHALRDNYGYPARFLLNYDYMLPLLLLSNEKKTESVRRRCSARPFAKQSACGGEYFEYVAGLTVILAYWKLRDDRDDSAPLKSVPPRVLLALYAGAYKKARNSLPEFDAVTERNIAELKELETARADSLDIPADKFARILSSAAAAEDGRERRRILEQILYHTGRWVYIVDAYADLKEDLKEGCYNPIMTRFALDGADCPKEIKEQIKVTLLHSLNMAASAFELLEPGTWTPIIENIIYLGMPYITDRVLDNNHKRRKLHEGSI